jgi:hypothetical protein
MFDARHDRSLGRESRERQSRLLIGILRGHENSFAAGIFKRVHIPVGAGRIPGALLGYKDAETARSQ